MLLILFPLFFPFNSLKNFRAVSCKQMPARGMEFFFCQKEKVLTKTGNAHKAVRNDADIDTAFSCCVSLIVVPNQNTQIDLTKTAQPVAGNAITSKLRSSQKQVLLSQLHFDLSKEFCMNIFGSVMLIDFEWSTSMRCSGEEKWVKLRASQYLSTSD